MAHFVRTKDDAAWKRGFFVAGAVMRDLDDKTSKAVDGHSGGTYTPSAAMIIGGAGVGVTGLWTLGASAYARPSGGSTLFVFGKNTDDDAFLFGSGHTGLTRSLFQTILESYGVFLGDFTNLFTGGSTVTDGIQPTQHEARFFVPFRTHDGATIDSVAVDLQVIETHAAVPQYLPRFRVVRVSADGVIEALRSEDTTTDSDGFQNFSPTPATAGAWNAAQAIQSFTYTCTQNNVIDLATYSYFLEIIEEGGTGAWASDGNIYVSTTTALSNVPRADNRT